MIRAIGAIQAAMRQKRDAQSGVHVEVRKRRRPKAAASPAENLEQPAREAAS